MKCWYLACWVCIVLAGGAWAQVEGDSESSPVIRIGMIGLDTSHATAFAAILNDPDNAKGHVPGGRVVAGVKQFSPDMEASVGRVDGYVDLLTTKFGLKMYDSIEAMLPHVDAVMVESVDGRPHLKQALPAIEAGKPTFVDKPMAASLEEVVKIFAAAKEHGTPVWSASNLRYHEGVVAAANAEADVGEVTAVFSYGPAPMEEHHLDLAWYGIHPVEAMFTVMGPGCERVTRTYTEGTDVVTGTWKDGRVGVLLGIRGGKRGYGVKVFGTKGIVEHAAGAAYPQLLEQVIAFFRTGEAPVSPEETIEIFEFMEAADESRRRGGEPVGLGEVRLNAESAEAQRAAEGK